MHRSYPTGALSESSKWRIGWRISERKTQTAHQFSAASHRRRLLILPFAVATQGCGRPNGRRFPASFGRLRISVFDPSLRSGPPLRGHYSSEGEAFSKLGYFYRGGARGEGRQVEQFALNSLDETLALSDLAVAVVHYPHLARPLRSVSASLVDKLQAAGMEQRSVSVRLGFLEDLSRFVATKQGKACWPT